MPPLILIGYGDIAARVARRSPTQAIYALARKAAPRPARHLGAWHSIVLDLDAPTPALKLPAQAIWLYLAPPPQSGTVDTRLANWLALQANQAPPRAVIYASTTGVYGDHAGGWITEATPPNPAHQRGQRRLHAEHQFTQWCAARAIALTILRITGIYAADRLPIARIKARAPVVCLQESPWSNRIHADDCADICTALIHRATQNTPITGVFNISDNTPRPMTELFLATAAHFGLPPPPCQPLAHILAEASPTAREFLTESKRIDASAIQRALNWQPRYPNLAATLAEMAKDNPSPTQSVTK
ncbi:MAG TPA: NAD-dependent epimerase/dehydratase family protein [Halothiobacillus sp.]|jgi:nucleoside-diphosphate-sugar epimerase|nr:NAD-dependent epimerase/dehydratase family protein [Halothiobacillus sp.]